MCANVLDYNPHRSSNTFVLTNIKFHPDIAPYKYSLRNQLSRRWIRKRMAASYLACIMAMNSL